MDSYEQKDIKSGEQPTLDTGRFRGVYDDTLYFVDGMVEQYDFYPDILDALYAGNASLELRKRYMLKAIDEKWVTKIEDCLPALDEIIRQPSRFIEETEKILPIEMSKNISSRSIQHLSQHTDYISKVEDDTVTPSKILNVFRDETMKTYENKFINTLLNRLYLFVERRYETALKEGKDEKNTSLDFSEDFAHGDVKAKLHFRVEISEEPKHGEELKNYTYTTDLWQRVIRLHHICRAYMNSDFVKNMDKQYVRPPIIRTNALLKNKNLRQCLELWEYIEGYDNIGYDMLIQENLEDVDKKYIKELYHSAALQYLIFRYNIKNEFEDDKRLSVNETDEVLSAQIRDESVPIKAEEFDRAYTKSIRVPDSPTEEKRPRGRKDRRIVRAVDVALVADSLMRRNILLENLPRRKNEPKPIKAIRGATLKVKNGARNAVKRADNYCRTHQDGLKRVADTATEVAVRAALVGTAVTVKMLEKRK